MVIDDSIKEHLIASEYGWTLDYIRQMRHNDFNKHYLICYIKHKVEIQKFKALINVRGVI